MLEYLNAQRGFYGDFSVYFVFFYKVYSSTTLMGTIAKTTWMTE